MQSLIDNSIFENIANEIKDNEEFISLIKKDLGLVHFFNNFDAIFNSTENNEKYDIDQAQNLMTKISEILARKLSLLYSINTEDWTKNQKILSIVINNVIKNKNFYSDLTEEICKNRQSYGIVNKTILNQIPVVHQSQNTEHYPSDYERFERYDQYEPYCTTIFSDPFKILKLSPGLNYYEGNDISKQKVPLPFNCGQFAPNVSYKIRIPSGREEIKGVVIYVYGGGQHSQPKQLCKKNQINNNISKANKINIEDVFLENGYIYAKLELNDLIENDKHQSKMDKIVFAKVLAGIKAFIDAWKNGNIHPAVNDFSGCPTILLGSSFGGTTILRFFQEYPNNVDGACVYNSQLGFNANYESYIDPLKYIEKLVEAPVSFIRSLNDNNSGNMSLLYIMNCFKSYPEFSLTTVNQANLYNSQKVQTIPDIGHFLTQSIEEYVARSIEDLLNTKNDENNKAKTLFKNTRLKRATILAKIYNKEVSFKEVLEREFYIEYLRLAKDRVARTDLEKLWKEHFCKKYFETLLRYLNQVDDHYPCEPKENEFAVSKEKVEKIYNNILTADEDVKNCLRSEFDKIGLDFVLDKYNLKNLIEQVLSKNFSSKLVRHSLCGFVAEDLASNNEFNSLEEVENAKALFKKVINGYKKDMLSIMKYKIKNAAKNSEFLNLLKISECNNNINTCSSLNENNLYLLINKYLKDNGLSFINLKEYEKYIIENYDGETDMKKIVFDIYSKIMDKESQKIEAKNFSKELICAEKNRLSIDFMQILILNGKINDLVIKYGNDEDLLNGVASNIFTYFIKIERESSIDNLKKCIGILEGLDLEKCLLLKPGLASLYDEYGLKINNNPIEKLKCYYRASELSNYESSSILSNYLIRLKLWLNEINKHNTYNDNIDFIDKIASALKNCNRENHIKAKSNYKENLQKTYVAYMESLILQGKIEDLIKIYGEAGELLNGLDKNIFEASFNKLASDSSTEDLKKYIVILEKLDLEQYTLLKYGFALLYNKYVISININYIEQLQCFIRVSELLKYEYSLISNNCLLASFYFLNDINKNNTYNDHSDFIDKIASTLKKCNREDHIEKKENYKENLQKAYVSYMKILILQGRLQDFIKIYNDAGDLLSDLNKNIFEDSFTELAKKSNPECIKAYIGILDELDLEKYRLLNYMRLRRLYYHIVLGK